VKRWLGFDLRLLLVPLLLVGGLTGVVWRLALEGERAMMQSDREFDQGRLRESLLSARRAASLYAPGLRHLRRADARLDAIARGAEAAQSHEVSVLAWQAIRSTERQRRWGFERPSDRAVAADQRLAALLADDGRQGSLQSQQQFYRRVLSDLQVTDARLGSTNLAQILSVGLLGLGLVATWGALQLDVGRRGWRLWVAAGIAVLGAVAWAVSLSLM
jgi:hypothetical protein